MQRQPDNPDAFALPENFDFSGVGETWDMDAALMNLFGSYTPLNTPNAESTPKTSPQFAVHDNRDYIDVLPRHNDLLNLLSCQQPLMSTSSVDNLLNRPTMNDYSPDTPHSSLQVNTVMGIDNPSLAQTGLSPIPSTGHDIEPLANTKVFSEEFMALHFMRSRPDAPAEESTTPLQDSPSTILQGMSTNSSASSTRNARVPSLISVNANHAFNTDILRFLKVARFWNKTLDAQLMRLLQHTAKSQLPQQTGCLEPTLLSITLPFWIYAYRVSTAYLYPFEHEEVYRDDGHVVCQLQGYIAGHNAMSWSFSDRKCGYTTRQFTEGDDSMELSTWNQHFLHVLKDHLGISSSEGSWVLDRGLFGLNHSTLARIRRELASSIGPSQRRHVMHQKFALLSCDPYDELGLLSPLLVFLLILGECSTEDLLEIVLPMAQRPNLSFQNQDISDISSVTCHLEAYISDRGQAMWINTDRPCGQLVSSMDNYRRHIIEQHFGVKRGKGGVVQRTWGRLLAAIRANMRLQENVNATSNSREHALQ